MSGGKTGYQTRSIAPSPITSVNRREQRLAGDLEGRQARAPGSARGPRRRGSGRAVEPLGELALVVGVLGREPEHGARAGREQVGVVVAKGARLGRAAAGAGDQVPVVGQQRLARAPGPRVGVDDRAARRARRARRLEPSVAASSTGGSARAREVVGGAVVDRAPAGRREACRGRSPTPILESAACSPSASSGSSTSWSARYLESGKPIGSAAIAEDPDVEWGPSTVRAELAALEREGYLTHPHTSAGRVPTDSGYRFYADALLVVRRRPRARQRRHRPLADAPRDRGGAARDRRRRSRG